MDNPFGEVVDHWEAVVEDTAATAAEYEDAGWTTVQLHPGNVTVVEEPGVGFDVVVPGEEYERLRETVDGREFDSYDVFRGEGGSQVFCLVVLESAAGDAAVLVPVYYGRADRELLEAAEALTTFVRGLSTEEAVTFGHEDPAPFFPEGRKSEEE